MNNSVLTRQRSEISSEKNETRKPRTILAATQQLLTMAKHPDKHHYNCFIIKVYSSLYVLEARGAGKRAAPELCFAFVLGKFGANRIDGQIQLSRANCIPTPNH